MFALKDYKNIFSSAKEVVFLLELVCLFVSEQHYLKSC